MKKLPFWNMNGCKAKIIKKSFLVMLSCNINSFEMDSKKIYFSCGNKFDQKNKIQITDSDMEAFCEQCHNLVSGIYKTSCKTGEGVEEMFADIANQLTQNNRSRMELQAMEETSFQVAGGDREETSGSGREEPCSC